MSFLKSTVSGRTVTLTSNLDKYEAELSVIDLLNKGPFIINNCSCF